MSYSYSPTCTYGRTAGVKYWEIIADNLKKRGWSWGCVLAIDSNGQTIFVVDSRYGDEKGFVIRADEKLTAFRRSLKNQGQSAVPSLNIER
jgi:hypothetical protein